MLLYRYFASHAYETLRDKRLRVSRIGSFNDPFEFSFRTVGEMTFEKARDYHRARLDHPGFQEAAKTLFPKLAGNKDKLRKAMVALIPENARKMVETFGQTEQEILMKNQIYANEILRLLCFSDSDVKKEDEILIWSHYASSHTGIRIGFEFPNVTNPFQIVKINYQSERVPIDLTGDLQPGSLDETIKSGLKTKSNAWSYEREYRMLIAPRECVIESGVDGKSSDYWPIKTEWVKRIDFGTRCSDEEKTRIKNVIATNYPHVKCFNAVYHKTDFALDYIAA